MKMGGVERKKKAQVFRIRPKANETVKLVQFSICRFSGNNVEATGVQAAPLSSGGMGA
jgi:hypothetical protein